jgi:hypothetical protein
MIEEQGTELIHVLISLAVLLFAAKLFTELFHKFKIPVVLRVLLLFLPITHGSSVKVLALSVPPNPIYQCLELSSIIITLII